MRFVDDYIDLAKKINGYTSDRELSRKMNVTAGTVNAWRKKRTWPNDESMVSLSDLAHVNRKVALIELNIWRATGSAKAVYQSMLKEILEAVAAIILFVCLIGSGTAHAGMENNAGTNHQLTTPNIHYARFKRWMEKLMNHKTFVSSHFWGST